MTFIIPDMFNGFTSIYLDIIMFIALFLAIVIIIAKNPIVSVLCLIFLFVSISSYLILIGLKFLGVSYLIIYVGAVSILFLFILMLINIRISELANDTNNYIPLAVLTVLAFFVPLSGVLPNNKYDLNKKIFMDSKELQYVSSSNWDTCIINSSDITSLGNQMYTSYSIWLIVTSVILLLSMVGCIIINIKQKY